MDDTKTTKTEIFSSIDVGSGYVLRFALALARKRFVLITGGYSAHKGYFNNAKVFDTKKKMLVEKPKQPNLLLARANHGSCVSEHMAFVFGGSTQGKHAQQVGQSLEYLRLSKSIYSVTSSANVSWNFVTIG